MTAIIPRELADIYDYDIKALRLPDGRCMSLFNPGWACVIRPWPASDDDGTVAAPPRMSEGVDEWQRAPLLARGTTTLGALLLWASRRTTRTHECSECPCGAGGCGTVFRAADAQHVAGAPMHRAVVREAVQAFVEAKLASETAVELTMRRLEGRVGDGGVLAPSTLLTIRSGDIECHVMGTAFGAKVGDDPLAVEWSTDAAADEARS